MSQTERQTDWQTRKIKHQKSSQNKYKTVMQERNKTKKYERINR